MPPLIEPVLTSGWLANTEQPTLISGAITLRPWTADDVDSVVAAYQEPEIQRWHVRTMTPLEAEEWIQAVGISWTEGTCASWAVELDGAFAGRTTLKIQPAFGQAEATYWVCGPWRGNGIAPGALTLATQWAFGVGVHRVELKHSTANSPSCRVAIKAGFELEGTRRSAMLHADGWHDMHLHARIADSQVADSGDDA